LNLVQLRATIVGLREPLEGVLRRISEGSLVNMSLASGRSRWVAARWLFFAAVLLTLVGASSGQAGTGGGGGKADLVVSITSTPLGTPPTNVNAVVPYSTSEAVYVRYVIDVHNNSKSTFTNVTLTDPATCATSSTGKPSCTPDTGWGGTIVFWNGGCTPPQGLPATTVTCGLGNMGAGADIVITVIAQTPAAPSADCGGTDPCLLTNQVEASGDEQFNDKPASHVDTSPQSTSLMLTHDTTASFTSVTIPNTGAEFFTDKTLGTSNVESTDTLVPSNGVSALVRLAEHDTSNGECASIKQAIGNTKLQCLPQVSSVSSDLSPYSVACPTASAVAGCLQMTFRVLASSIPSTFKLNKFQVVHFLDAGGTELVPLCPAVATISGDCLSAAPVFDADGNLVFTAVGPGNGGWGGG
jgi:hypothetical protein